MRGTTLDNQSQPELAAMTSSAFLNAPIAMCLFDLDQQAIAFSNESAQRSIDWITGNTEDQNGSSVSQANALTFRSLLKARESDIRSGKLVELDWTSCCADGVLVPFYVSVYRLSSECNHIAICSFRDDRGRQETEGALRLTEFSVEVAPEAMFTVAPNGQILNANRTACSRLEYSREELLAMKISDIDPHYPAELWPDHWKELRRDGRMFVETQHKTKSGRILDVEVSISYFEFGGTEYCCSSIRDVTDRKAAEHLLKMQRTVLESIAADRSLVRSLDLICENVQNLIPNSLASIKLLNNEVQKLEIAAGPDLSDHHRQLMDHSSPGEGRGPCSAVVIRSQAVIVNDVMSDPVFSKVTDKKLSDLNATSAWSYTIHAEGRLVGTIAVALSKHCQHTNYHKEIMEGAASLAAIAIQRKHEEQELENNRNELAHVARLSTMGEMVAGLAHELNQPLTVIANLGYTIEALIASQAADKDESVHEYATIIREQSVRAGEIIRRLRGFVKRAENKRSRTVLNDVVKDGLTLMESDIRSENIQVEMEYCEADVRPFVDAIQIQQVVVNLLRNSIDSLKENQRDDRRLDVKVIEHGGTHVEIVIRDNGPGIPGHEVDNVFDAFFTTKDSGMGMGLAISRSIIEAHCGELTANRQLDRGAEFSVMIPVGGQTDE